MLSLGVAVVGVAMLLSLSFPSLAPVATSGVASLSSVERGFLDILQSKFI